MSNGSAIEQAGALLGPFAQDTTAPEAGRLDVAVAAADLVGAVRALRAARWGSLIGITGLDGGPAGALEALYHFAAGATVVTLRVQARRDAPVVPSICGVIPSATLFEREIIEMFGIEVEGTPNTDRLFLSDDWPHGVYPLRKDFKGEEKPA
jgi:NADH:ubiquinone oxidoreductase subunit C